MQLKNVLVQALLVGFAAATYSTQIEWDAKCTQDTIVNKWSAIRTALANKLPMSKGELGPAKFNKVKQLLNDFTLPRNADLEVIYDLIDITGTRYMDGAIGSVLNDYLRDHPCPRVTSVVVPVVTSSARATSTTSSIHLGYSTAPGIPATTSGYFASSSTTSTGKYITTTPTTVTTLPVITAPALPTITAPALPTITTTSTGKYNTSTTGKYNTSKSSTGKYNTKTSTGKYNTSTTGKYNTSKSSTGKYNTKTSTGKYNTKTSTGKYNTKTSTGKYNTKT
ncbi:hypothetical protein GGF37_005612, partial [Kickxella alabastrina]